MSEWWGLDNTNCLESDCSKLSLDLESRSSGSERGRAEEGRSQFQPVDSLSVGGWVEREWWWGMCEEGYIALIPSMSMFTLCEGQRLLT